MAIPVGIGDVEQVLRPWLGSMLLSSTPIAGQVAATVMEYAPYRQTLQELKTSVESELLMGVNRITGGSMCVVLDDYCSKKLMLQDIQTMTDEVMGLVFDSLTPFSANFTKLNDYALREESLSALRVLYQKYRKFFTPEEYDFLVHMVRKIYPPQRYASWLANVEEP